MSKRLVLWNSQEYYATSDDPDEQYELDQECEEDWDEVVRFFDELLDNDTIFVAFGTVGTWRGDVRGGKIIWTPQDLYDLLQDENKIYVDKEGLHLITSHHDGVNYIDFRVLNERGKNWLLNNHDLEDRETVVETVRRACYSQNFYKHYGGSLKAIANKASSLEVNTCYYETVKEK